MILISCTPGVYYLHRKTISLLFLTPPWWSVNPAPNNASIQKPYSGLSGSWTYQLTLDLYTNQNSYTVHAQSWRPPEKNTNAWGEKCHLARTPAEVTRYDGPRMCMLHVDGGASRRDRHVVSRARTKRLLAFYFPTERDPTQRQNKWRMVVSQLVLRRPGPSDFIVFSPPESSPARCGKGYECVWRK